MNVEQEHWNLKDGQLKGLWSVDPFKAKGADMWQRIDEIISAYAYLHRMEVELTVRQNKEQQKAIFNDHAASTMKGGSNLRWGCSLPPGLMFKITTIYPEVFSNRDIYHKFLNKYPGFKIARRV